MAKRSKAFIKRSKASKKGWVTRKKKQKLVARIEIDKQKISNASRGKEKLRPLRNPKKHSVNELQQTIEFLEKRIKELENAAPPQFIRADGSIGLAPSYIRTLRKRDKRDIQRDLTRASKKSEIHFRVAAGIVAQVYDIPLQEVYTFWYSP